MKQSLDVALLYLSLFVHTRSLFICHYYYLTQCDKKKSLFLLWLAKLALFVCLFNAWVRKWRREKRTGRRRRRRQSRFLSQQQVYKKFDRGKARTVGGGCSINTPATALCLLLPKDIVVCPDCFSFLFQRENISLIVKKMKALLDITEEKSFFTLCVFFRHTTWKNKINWTAGFFLLSIHPSGRRELNF